MQNVSVARRYARALLDAAGPSADAVLVQLEALVSYFEADHEAWVSVSSPAITRPQRLATLEVMMKAIGGVASTLVNLLKLLTDRNRFEVLPTLARQYRDMVDVSVGRVRGKVTSATKLGDEQLVAIKQSLETISQRNVVLEANVDPSILGGVVAQVGSRTFDGSLRRQLQDLGQQLIRPATAH